MACLTPDAAAQCVEAYDADEDGRKAGSAETQPEQELLDFVLRKVAGSGSGSELPATERLRATQEGVHPGKQSLGLP